MLYRQRQDLNLRGQSPSDFKSDALTTRPLCLLYVLGGLAQSVECDVRNVEAEGSKPSFSSFYQNNAKRHPLNIYLSRGMDYTIGGLAQLVECVVSNDEARGSKPRFSIFLKNDQGMIE